MSVPAVSFHRFVALGDSTTEGIGDTPHEDGRPRGWADRFAARLAGSSPGLLYANLAVRGRRVADVRREQLEPAIALEPDLASVIAGINDILRPRFDLDLAIADLEAIYAGLAGCGATVLTATFPDVSAFSPAARPYRNRVRRFNDRLRVVAGEHGLVVADIGGWPAAIDPRSWSEDRLHLSPLGHQLLADALLAALWGASDASSQRLKPVDREHWRRRVAEDLRWGYRYFVPWIRRRLTGRSTGDGCVAKLPMLTPVHASARGGDCEHFR